MHDKLLKTLVAMIFATVAGVATASPGGFTTNSYMSGATDNPGQNDPPTDCKKNPTDARCKGK